MRLGYVTTYDARDIGGWSGIGFCMARGLAAGGADVDLVGPLRDAATLRVALGGVGNRMRRREAFRRERDPAIARSYARQAAQRLARLESEIAFSPGTVPIAYLETSRPVAFWTDATFGALVDFYPEFSRLGRRSVRDGHRLEQRALARCDAAVYSSEWAARGAMERYDADPAKVHVVPFGANLVAPEAGVLEAAIDARPTDRCRLVFIGADWVRKRGAFAVAVVEELRRSGMPTEITMIGAPPPPQTGLPRGTRALGFIDKRRPAHVEALQRTLLEAHVLIVPSLADCTPVAVCEAFAFGVPVVAADVGGMRSLVRSDSTGTLLPRESTPSDYAVAIAALVDDGGRYRAATRLARAEHVERLNWQAGGRRVVEILTGLRS